MNFFPLASCESCVEFGRTRKSEVRHLRITLTNIILQYKLVCVLGRIDLHMRNEATRLLTSLINRYLL